MYLLYFSQNNYFSKEKSSYKILLEKYCFIIISWVRKLYLTYRILNRIIEIANVTKLTNTVNDLKTILTKKTYLYYYICTNRVGKFIFD